MDKISNLYKFHVRISINDTKYIIPIVCQSLGSICSRFSTNLLASSRVFIYSVFGSIVSHSDYFGLTVWSSHCTYQVHVVAVFSGKSNKGCTYVRYLSN